MNLISKIFFINSWDVSNTYIVNTILSSFNAIFVFVVSLSLWKNKKIAFYNSIFYITSIPILVFYNAETTFTLAATLILFFVYFLYNFYLSANRNYIYLILAIFSSLVLFNTHHIFLLLPIVFVAYFILTSLSIKKFKLLFDLKKNIFYIFIFLLALPVILLNAKFSYLSANSIDL